MRIPTYRWNRHRKQGEPATSCTPAEVRCDCNTLGLGHVLGACNFIGPNVYHVNAKSLKTRKQKCARPYTAVSHNINCGNLVWVWKLVSRLRVIPRIAFTTDLSLFSTTEEATTEIRRGM